MEIAGGGTPRPAVVPNGFASWVAASVKGSWGITPGMMPGIIMGIPKPGGRMTGGAVGIGSTLPNPGWLGTGVTPIPPRPPIIATPTGMTGFPSIINGLPSLVWLCTPWKEMTGCRRWQTISQSGAATTT